MPADPVNGVDSFDVTLARLRGAHRAALLTSQSSKLHSGRGAAATDAGLLATHEAPQLLIGLGYGVRRKATGESEGPAAAPGEA